MTAASSAKEHSIVAKINESLVHSISYGKVETDIYHEIAIYQNGSLNPSLLSSNGVFYGTNEFHLLVNIFTYQAQEAGEYIAVTYADPSERFSDNGCWSYFSFVDAHVAFIHMIWHVETLQIHTTGNTY